MADLRRGSNSLNSDRDKTFQGTLVHRALTSLHGGSLEIMLSVPLILAAKNLNIDQLKPHDIYRKGILYSEIVNPEIIFFLSI